LCAFLYLYSFSVVYLLQFKVNENILRFKKVLYFNFILLFISSIAVKSIN